MLPPGDNAVSCGIGLQLAATALQMGGCGRFELSMRLISSAPTRFGAGLYFAAFAGVVALPVPWGWHADAALKNNISRASAFIREPARNRIRMKFTRGLGDTTNSSVNAAASFLFMPLRLAEVSGSPLTGR